MKRFLVAAFLTACAHVSSAERELLRADAAFNDDVAARGVDGWVAAFAADGVMLPNGGPMLKGSAIREGMAELGKTLKLRWAPVSARISDDGTLGYTIGNYTAETPRGMSQGKYLTVWKRTPEGWRVVADIGNPGEIGP
jgi:ketosteroid isomerase-like protein